MTKRKKPIGHFLAKSNKTAGEKLAVFTEWAEGKRDEQLRLIRRLENYHIDMDNQDARDTIYQLFASVSKMHKSLPASAKKLLATPPDDNL